MHKKLKEQIKFRSCLLPFGPKQSVCPYAARNVGIKTQMYNFDCGLVWPDSFRVQRIEKDIWVCWETVAGAG